MKQHTHTTQYDKPVSLFFLSLFLLSDICLQTHTNLNTFKPTHNEGEKETKIKIEM